MTTDEDGALSLVRDHLREIEPPPGAKARVSLELEERITGRARSARPLWVLGLAGALVAGASLAASQRGSWFGSEPELTAPAKPAAPVSLPSPAKRQRAHSLASDVAKPAPLEDDAESRVAPEVKTQSTKRATVSSRRVAPDTTLAKQVAELRAAMAYAERDDQRALAELRAFKRRWANGPLNHEADVEIVAALRRLGRDAESRAAAKRFVRAHPDSAKVPEMNAVAKEPEAP